MFMAAAPLSTAVGSPISGGLMELDGLLGIAGWKWLFVLEAIPALVLGVVVLFYLTDRPEKATWLSRRSAAGWSARWRPRRSRTTRRRARCGP